MEIKFRQTTALKKIKAMKKRLKIVQGGSSAGKTIAILLLMINKAQSINGNLASVVSETMPHIRRGALRDFLAILENHNYFNENRWDRTNLIYTFETGSRIEFFSADQPGKVRGPRRNDLFLNEVNSISYETYTQLAIRTDGEIFLDYNPVAEFFVHTELIPKQDHDFVLLTYKDNEALSSEIVREIESRQSNKMFWQVYGLGQLGEVEGKIYRDWEIIDEIPHVARLERYGLDFGYSNDPTAIVAIYYCNGGYILDEVLFQKGLSNKQIADTLNNQPKALVVADSAEPKSIDEIKIHGINIVAAEKGQDSVRSGIQLVQAQRISVTKRSVNLIKEYRNYLWETDRDGNTLNVPEHFFSHSMDGLRYGLVSLLKKPKINMEASPIISTLKYYPEIGV